MLLFITIWINQATAFIVIIEKNKELTYTGTHL